MGNEKVLQRTNFYFMVHIFCIFDYIQFSFSFGLASVPGLVYLDDFVAVQAR